MMEHMKKHIVFFIDSLGCGGAEKSLVTLLSYISKKYHITVYAVALGGLLESDLPDEVELKQVAIPKFSLYSRCKKKVSFIYNYLKGKRPNPVESYWQHYSKFIPPISEQFDIAIAYQQGFPTYFVAEKVKANKKIAWINADIIRQNYTKQFNIKYYGYYNNIVCVSLNLKKILLSDYAVFKEKMAVINDIIPVEKIIEMSTWPIDNFHASTCVNIVTVGRLTPVKGYDLALKAAYILHSQNISFKWFFIGDGSERNFIEEQISKLQLGNNIILTGTLPNPYPYIRMADIYVQPSYSEGFGIALREAMILCKPIVATDFEVVHNLISDNKNGLICKKDANAIAQSLVRLINDVSLRNEFSNNLEKELYTKGKDTELNRIIELIETTR